MCKNLARPDHPFHKFSSGNLQTLKEAPEASGIDVRQRLLDFHATYYSSNVLKLVILGKEPLDVLQKWVDEKFSPMKNKNLPIPKFPGAPYQEAQLKKVVKVVPVRDARTLQMIWPLPSVREFYRSKPTRYLAHLVGHESEGSITALLKEKGWANELSAGVSTNYSDFAAFAVTIELTEQGLAQVNDVMLAVFQYIQMLKAAAPQEWIHDEIKVSRAVSAELHNRNFTTTSFAFSSGRGSCRLPIPSKVSAHDVRLIIGGLPRALRT